MGKNQTNITCFCNADALAKFGCLRLRLYGYGGFEISLTPVYSGARGIAWLEHGGVWIDANIRGGGEYGPRWHQAAKKANRHSAGRFLKREKGLNLFFR